MVLEDVDPHGGRPFSNERVPARVEGIELCAGALAEAREVSVDHRARVGERLGAGAIGVDRLYRQRGFGHVKQLTRTSLALPGALALATALGGCCGRRRFRFGWRSSGHTGQRSSASSGHRGGTSGAPAAGRGPRARRVDRGRGGSRRGGRARSDPSRERGTPRRARLARRRSRAGRARGPRDVRRRGERSHRAGRVRRRARGRSPRRGRPHTMPP